MELITSAQRERLISNYAAEDWAELPPVVKLFTPDAGATWLLTTLDPSDGDTLWGLCDLGLGFPELGTVSLTELCELRGALGLPVERDLHVTLDRATREYADLAAQHQRITVPSGERL